MLVLTRRTRETVVVNGNVVVTVVSVRGDRVRLGFEAPDSVSVLRGELKAILDEENRTHIRNREPAAG